MGTLTPSERNVAIEAKHGSGVSSSTSGASRQLRATNIGGDTGA